MGNSTKPEPIRSIGVVTRATVEIPAASFFGYKLHYVTLIITWDRLLIFYKKSDEYACVDFRIALD